MPPYWVTGPLRSGRRHVLGHRHGGDHIDRQLLLGGKDHSGDHCCGTAHIGGHVMHVGRRLDGDAAGVERDALADQGDLLGLALGAVVREPHQTRRARRALADADHATIAVLGQGLVVEHLDLEARRFTQSLCALGEFGRIQMTRRGVDEIAGCSHRGRDCRRAPGRLFSRLGGSSFLTAQHRDLAQTRILGCGLGAAEIGEPVGAEDQALDRRAQVEVRQCGEHGLGAVERARGHPRRAANHVGGPLVAVLTQADRQHAGHG
jgi:hypothetical protein